jgi:excisionase family DNA binding protein
MLDLVALAQLPAQIAALQAEIKELRAAMGAKPANDVDLVDVATAAKMLAITEAALRRATSRGTIPAVRFGRRVRYRRSDLLLLAV